MTITVRYTVTGLDEWGAKARELILRVADANFEATRDGLHRVEAAEKQLLTLFPHPPRTRTPSPPGSPPGLISGHLRIGVWVDGPWQLSLTEVEGSVGPTAEYARIQEMGGHTGRGHATYLPPRPYHWPTVEAMIPLIYQDYAEHFARAIYDTLHSGG